MLRKTMLFKVFALVGLGAAGCAVTDNAGSSQARSRWAAMDEKARLNVEPAIPPKILPETFFAAAQLLEQQNYLEKSIVQYRHAVMSNHEYVAAYHRLGLLLSRTGHNVEAGEALARAVELMPDSAILRNNLGFEYVLQQKWELAERELRKAVELSPTFARAHINLGLVLGKLQRFDEASECLMTVLNESDAYYNLGLIYRAQDRYEDAADAFRAALEIDSRFIAAGTQLAQINARLHPQAMNEPEEPGEADTTNESPLASAEDGPEGALVSNTVTEKGVADVASETSYGPVLATANGVYDPFADKAEPTGDSVSAPKAEYEMGRGPVRSDGTGDFDEKPCLAKDLFVDPDYFGAAPIATADMTTSEEQSFVADAARVDHGELGAPGVVDGAAADDDYGMNDEGPAAATGVIANADSSATRFPSDNEPNHVTDESTNDLYFVEGPLPLGERGQPVASRRIPASWLAPGDPGFDYDGLNDSYYELDDSRIAFAFDAMGPTVACDLVASWPDDDLSDSDGAIEPSTLSATIIDEDCEDADDRTDLGHIVPLWFAPPMNNRVTERDNGARDLSSVAPIQPRRPDLDAAAFEAEDSGVTVVVSSRRGSGEQADAMGTVPSGVAVSTVAVDVVDIDWAEAFANSSWDIESFSEAALWHDERIPESPATPASYADASPGAVANPTRGHAPHPGDLSRGRATLASSVVDAPVSWIDDDTGWAPSAYDGRDVESALGNWEAALFAIPDANRQYEHMKALLGDVRREIRCLEEQADDRRPLEDEIAIRVSSAAPTLPPCNVDVELPGPLFRAGRSDSMSRSGLHETLLTMRSSMIRGLWMDRPDATAPLLD